MSLVPVSAISEYTGSEGPDGHEFDAQLEQIRVEKARLSKTVAFIMANIKSMFSSLNAASSDLSAEIRLMQKEIQILEEEARQRIAKNRPPPDDLDVEFRAYEEEFNESDFQDHSFENPAEDYTQENPELVSMFRKIAAKTHPDRTDDPELHLLFISAKSCRQRNDFVGMKDIYDFLIGKASALVTQLMRRLAAELNALDMLRSQLIHLRAGDDYKLFKLWETDKNVVLQLSRTQIQERRNRIYAHLLMLRHQAGIVEEPQSFFVLSR